MADHTGDYIICKINKGYALFEKQLTLGQQTICDRLLQTLLPRIYRDIWENEKTKILQKYDLSEIPHELAIVTVPFCGRTHALCTYISLLLLTVPDIRLCIITTTKRMSYLHIRLIVSMLTVHPYFTQNKFSIITQTSDQLVINWNTGEITYLDVYPASIELLRGLNADNIIIDNGNSVSDTFMEKSILPIIQQQYTSLNIFGWPPYQIRDIYDYTMVSKRPSQITNTYFSRFVLSHPSQDKFNKISPFITFHK